MSKTYSIELVEALVDKIETLALQNKSLQRQIDIVDAVVVGTKYNWKGTGKGRIDMLKEMLAKAEERSGG